MAREMKDSGVAWIGGIPADWQIVKFSRIASVKCNLVAPDDYLELPQISPESIEKGSGKLLSYKTVKFLNFEERILPFIEIFQVLCIAIITPLKIVPNNLLTNKIINVLSLLSVAFAFWSIYMNEVTSAMIDRSREERRKFFQTSEHYLNIIRRISETQQFPEEGVMPDGNDRKTL